MATERAMLIQLVQMINDDKMVLPSLPEVAMNVRNLAVTKSVALERLVQEINKDPALAARMVALANSAGFGGDRQADSLSKAAKRLGEELLRNQASAAAMHQLFFTEQPTAWEVLETLWQSNIEVASCALGVLACQHEQGSLLHLNSDTLLLACQVHNIGALPLIKQFERYPHLFTDHERLMRVIERLSPQLGEAVLKHWNFPPELVETARYWADLSYQTPSHSYLDLVRLAAIYSRKLVLVDPLPSTLDLFVRKGVIPNLELFGKETYFMTYNEVMRNLARSTETA
ncbi:HDOD domain-containing protein [Ferrimonas gelatinilytica]|uniref:HDOD domain-containing protein n=1 Tax=Ferrimonas gelatinilytica TaxID=1255257 RepID=A0ABP9S4X3_9GAMM